MPPALAIAAKDLRQRLRDRSAIVLGVVAPVLIAALMSFAFRGAENFHFTMGFVDADGGPVAASLSQVLSDPSLRQVVTVRPLGSPAAAREAVRGGQVQAALVVPAGFSSAVQTTRPLPITVVSDVNNTIAGNVTASIAESFVAQINADRLSVAAALAAGAPAGSLPELARQAADLQIPVQTAEVPVSARQLTTMSYYAPAMAIFFLLFTVTFTARSYFVDRATGMIDRIRAAPVRPIEVLVGKALSVLVFGAASLAVIGLVTSALFGADWGDPLAAIVLGLAMVLAVVCLTALVIAVARTQRQAEGLGSIAVFTLALLGGNFVLLSSAPPVMQRLALATPNGWALRGFTDLATSGGGLGTVAVPVVAILVFCSVTGALAAWLAPRALGR